MHSELEPAEMSGTGPRVFHFGIIEPAMLFLVNIVLRSSKTCDSNQSIWSKPLQKLKSPAPGFGNATVLIHNILCCLYAMQTGGTG